MLHVATLFCLYPDIIFNKALTSPIVWMKINVENIRVLRYADDTVILSDSVLLLLLVHFATAGWILYTDILILLTAALNTSFDEQPTYPLNSSDKKPVSGVKH